MDSLEMEKGMMNENTTPSDRTIASTVRVNIPPTSAVSDKTTKQSKTLKLRRRITRPVVLNTLLIIIVFSLLVFLEFGFIPGNHQGFYCEDPQISYKYNGEVVSPIVLGIGCIFLPFITLILADIFSRNSFRDINFGEIWFYYKECATGCVLVLLLTEVAKTVIGEPRPHFLDVCQPDTANNCIPNTYIETFRCTNTKYSPYFLLDSSRSFPSGHASLSWFTGTFSAYVIQSRLSTIHTGRLFKPFLLSICLTWSLVCSLTRISDRRHHWWDVLAGSFLGIVGALYTINIVHKKMCDKSSIPKVASSTTTLLDVKNKDATSVII